MADDPFAQYAVTKDDPFAAYATAHASASSQTVHPVSSDEPDTYGGGYVKGLKEQFAPGAMLDRGIQGARGVLRGATDLINPLTYVEAAQAVPGALRTLAKVPSQSVGETAAQVGGALMGIANDPYSLGRLAGGFASPTVAGGAMTAAKTLPAGRLLTAGAAGAKAGVLRLPIVGAPMRAAGRAAYRSWQETAPVAETAAEVAAPTAATIPAAGEVQAGLPRVGSSKGPAYDLGSFSDNARATILKAIEKDAAGQAAKPAPMASHVPGPEFQPVDVPVAQPAPTRGAGPLPDQPLGLQPGFSPRDVADAATQMQRENPNIVAEAEQMRQRAALKGPRIRTGAERVGREAGMTKEAVREVTGPVLDEAVGEASPILPKQALTKIIDDMKALAPGADREAYVARATSGKTKWQVENIRRTLEHLGLIVPVAVSVREGLERLMSNHGSEN
jgi:hypothetical protein